MDKQYKEIIEKIKNADAILVGASNGLSISEGLNLFAYNQAFIDLFYDLSEKYGIQSIIQGSFFKYPTEVDKWTFLSRLIYHYSGNYTGSKNMINLKKIISNKPYFILTSNGEGHFLLSGFDSQCIFEIEGNWLNMQCAHACHKKLYPTKDIIEKLVHSEKNGRVNSDLIPKCPKCNGNMQINVPLDEYFINDDEAFNRYKSFINKYHEKNIVVLELGIGWRNQMIKAPLMNLVKQEPNATYITINKGEIYIPGDIAEKSYGLDGDMTYILDMLSSEKI